MVELTVLLLLLFVVAANARACLRGRFRGMALLAALLKLVAAGGAGLLFWYVFRGEEIRRDADRGEQERELVVLEDHSLSMELRGDADGTTRERYREQALATAERLARESGVVLRRFCFGGNVVPADELPRLDRGRTRLTAAVEAVAARVGQGGVLVLTDACAGEREAGGFGKAQAEERGVRFAAVACLGAEQIWREVAMSAIEAKENNPERASVKVRVSGLPVGGAAVVGWRLDGAEHGASRLGRSGTAICPLAELPPGWHELEASVPAMPGEICARNNTRRAVFRVSGQRHVVFVHGRVDREQVGVVRSLRERLGDRLLLVSEEEAVRRVLPPESVALVVIGRVPAQSIGPGLRECIRAESTKTLLLGSEFLGGWDQTRQLLAGVEPARSLPAAVPLQPRSGDGAFGALAAAGLPVQRHFPGTPLPGKAVMEGGGGGPAILVADALRDPGFAILLLDDTWRWQMSPDPAVRGGYETFWRALFDWLLPGEQAVLELRVELAPPPGTTARLVVKPSASLAEELPPSLDVLVSRGEDPPRRLSARYRREDRLYACEIAYDVPGEVWWVTAEMQAGERLLRSPRVPVFRELACEEYDDPVPDLGACAAVATDPAAGVGTAADCERIVRGMLDMLPSAPQLSSRERSFRRELVLAAVIALALAFEWLLERTVLRSAP